MDKFMISTTIFALLFACSSQFSDELDYNADDAGCAGEDVLPCFSGGCYTYSQICDGFVDCDDASDENFCTLHKPDSEVCKETHQFTCADGGGCIPNSWLCNNSTDCDDGSDELNCTQAVVDNKNTNCKGFQCGDGKCISNLWVCDGHFDCDDRSDEYTQDLCKHVSIRHAILDGTLCQELPSIGERSYKCLDSSYCLPSSMMCDGMPDCRDGTDEGPFCANWHTMCNNFTCIGNDTKCSPERYGPTCLCIPAMAMRQYNFATGKCDDVNECLMERPQCSHTCVNGDGHFTCECDYGYKRDEFGYLCYAQGPEALLFFSTGSDIRYFKVKSNQTVVIASDTKKVHGLSYDGTYVYWVETAEGHQSIFKAQLDDVKDTKQVLVGLGLEEPGDIAVDYLGGNIYFSDSERGIISACRVDGSICTTIKTQTKQPRFVTLDAKNGNMYWADHHSRAVIMSARMDGSQPDVLVDNLLSAATGLAIDAPNERLYFVDKTIRVVMIHGKHVYSLFEEPFHYPYSVSVFENTVFWSDWTTNTVQTMDKLHGSGQKRNAILKLDKPVFGMHIYHPVLMNTSSNPCSNNECSHLCFVTSNTSHVCACPDGMEIQNSNKCVRIGDYRARYLVVGGGQLFTRIQYDELGNPESHATHFDIGRVQAMAYDNVRDSLYLYDAQFKTIKYINMSEFTLGLTHPAVFYGLENVVDMDYDYATDSLYILDAGRRLVEALSIRTQKRAIVYKFGEEEVPISLCIMSDYGRMMVAVVEKEQHDIIHIDSIGLNGEDRRHIIMNNLKGPHIRLRYVKHMDNVFISDESNGVIDYIHPDGTGKENYRELLTTVTSLAVADNYVFWTDRRTPRLFWSDLHDTTQKTRRIELALFPNKIQLLLQATTSAPDQNDPLMYHSCLKNVCSDVCVQVPHDNQHSATYMQHNCLCSPGLVMKNGKCTQLVSCGENKIMCHKSNVCVLKAQKCDGEKDCPFGEDEEGCSVVDPNEICDYDEIFCNGVCINKRITPMCPGKAGDTTTHKWCTDTQYLCANSTSCISRTQLCDGRADCPGADDELPAECDTLTCYDTEFMCASGSCIMKSWTCDGDRDCNDGSDEINCPNATCSSDSYQCRNRECVELKRRCDGHQDCFDFSDEEDCEEHVLVEITAVRPHCAAWEYTCEHDTSICLPYTARCNNKPDCPGGSDESGCDVRCRPHGMFACAQQLTCVSMRRVCDSHLDCVDGSDETPDACAQVNRSSRLFPMHSLSDCDEGFRCKDGQCIEWRQVCDNHTDCFDGSDENGLCLTACVNNHCSDTCYPAPSGPQCTCSTGFKLAADQRTCEDINECEDDVCAQECYNTRGSYRCLCYRGYALRSDERSCKAIEGNLSILYVSGNKVRAISAVGRDTVEYSDEKMSIITDMDYNIRLDKLYVTSAAARKLVEINSTHNVITVTNIGVPTRMAVDWVTGNVYFVDATPGSVRVRVCHVHRKRCAALQKLPSDARITALIVDPYSHLMFYCVNRDPESVVWSASLSGRLVTDLITVHNCTGLAVDMYKKRLYIAENGPDHIIRVDYEGHNLTKVLSEQSELQAPRGLVIFEDHIYYSNPMHLGRCLLYGRKTCETYVSRVLNDNKFVIRRDGLHSDVPANSCDGVTCSNVCALDTEGAVCICDDGTRAKDGECPKLEKKLLPLFNGWSSQELESAHHVSFSIITAVMALVVMYLCVFVYYHFIYKPRRDRAATYAEVRYQNSSAESATFTNSAPTIQITTGGAPSHEFVNPLQYVRNMWYSSFRRHIRPTRLDDVAVTMPSSPPQQDLSDTESDLDDKENKRFFRRKL